MGYRLFRRTEKELKLSRRTSSVDEVFQAAVEKVNVFAAAPLRGIYERLSIDLEQAKCSFLSKSLSEDELEHLCTYICNVVDRLPQSFEERFFFDTVFIWALARDFANELPLSGMVIPRYGQAWGHERLVLPWEKNAQHDHPVHLIHFRGRDRLEDVDLLDYPWIAHEWGHYIMLRHDSSFSQDFQGKLDGIIKSLRLSAFADRGSVKHKSQRHVKELIGFWTPSADHRNWAHELAIDLLSLWTCGPAYLACFRDFLERKCPNPYMIDQDHPPYSVRAEALIDGARQLGLGAYTDGLESIVAGWVKSKWQLGKDNHFIGLSKKEIVQACAESAFGFCKSLNLARCPAEHVDRLRNSASSPNTADFGLDLLLNARIVFVEEGEAAYNVWERVVVGRLASEVMR